MRQETRLVEHCPRGALQIVDRGLRAQLRQLVAGRAIAQLGLVAQREQHLTAAGSGARARDVEHFFDRHVRALAPLRRMRERAVVADVPAQLRQRHEDLGAVRDDPAAHVVTSRARRLQQIVEWRAE